MNIRTHITSFFQALLRTHSSALHIHPRDICGDLYAQQSTHRWDPDPIADMVIVISTPSPSASVAHIHCI